MFQMFQLPFMSQAFIAAAITGILLAYMGLHVVGRGIVFVDLALGQISSLGVAFAVFIVPVIPHLAKVKIIFEKIWNMPTRFEISLFGFSEIKENFIFLFIIFTSVHKLVLRVQCLIRRVCSDKGL